MTPAVVETFYRGIRYRSRLEARYAVLFDALDIKAHYELEGFKLESGRWYLPDFYLPETGIWVEVKGPVARLDRPLLLETAGLLEAKRPGAPVLMVCGPLPRKGPMRLEGHDLWQHPCHTALIPMRRTVRLGLVSLEREAGPCCCRTPDTLPGKNAEPAAWDQGDAAVSFEGWLEGGSRYTESPATADLEVVHAYQHALSARFEHGQSGAGPLIPPSAARASTSN